MISVSDKRQSTSIRALQTAARPSIFYSALMLLPAMMSMTSTLLAQANAAGPPADVVLMTYADSALDRVCIGESVKFSVMAIRRNNPAVRINGVAVRNSVLGPCCRWTMTISMSRVRGKRRRNRRNGLTTTVPRMRL